MTGYVDLDGRALLEVEIQSTTTSVPRDLAVWIDTGFTGELVLPRMVVDQLALIETGTVSAILADGSQVSLLTHSCVLNWFGQQKRLQVVANDGEYPLLGVGLLSGRELRIDYRSMIITLS